MASPVPCTPCCTTPQVVNIPGTPGLNGAQGNTGLNGVNAFTVTTADFVVPVTGSTVTLTVLNTAFMVLGQVLIIGNGPAGLTDPGPMNGLVTAIPSATTVTVKALGYPGDIGAGNTIGSGTNTGGANVSPAGLQIASPVGIAFGGTGQASGDAASRAFGQRRRLLAFLIGANFNVTTDQALTLVNGVLPSKYVIEEVYATNASTNMTTAAGGIYTAPAKGGTVIVPAAQVYTALTTATKFKALTIDATGGGPTTDTVNSAALYLSLTTGQGAAATADVYVFGADLA